MPSFSPNYIPFQSSKMLSAYGGIGSIIETPKGAVLIEEFENWRFFRKGLHNLENHELEDERLLERLKYHFPKLEKLVRIPTNTPDPNFQLVPQDKDMVASAKYFPEWFYCNHCESFKHINDWWRGWNSTLKKYKNNITYIRNSFIPPKCYICNDKNVLRKRKKYLRYELEQVRFIMTAPNGDIRDIPWEMWSYARTTASEEDSHSGGIELGECCCDNQYLKYIKSTKFADLAGIRIQCSNCKSYRTLVGLFRLRIGKDSEKQFKPVIRTSNSVYYPLLINSIFLPREEELISANYRKLIDDFLKSSTDYTAIFKIFESKYSKKTIEKYLNLREKNEIVDFEDENTYRLKEYQFLHEHPNYKEPNNNLTYRNQDVSNLIPYGINKLINIKRLKLTTVQVGYTRQNPFDKDNLNNENEIKAKLRYTSTKKNQTDVLPAIESFGEGIFIDFDQEKMETWFSNQFQNNHHFKERLEIIRQNELNSEFLPNKRFQETSLLYLAKFLLLHTISHILMKELEFLCGYPASSLSERLYVDRASMQGILIYTIAGFEGSYGGLVTQGNPENFERILKSAINRAKDCASDPVCYHSEGQGIGGLNLAACFSCSLLPETSCEQFNSFLDRALLVDEKYGFIE